MLKEEVDEEDMGSCLQVDGNSDFKTMQGELEKLIHMEEKLRERIVGQDEAAELIANAVRRSRSGLSDPNRPVGSFIFLGPTGVGKTYWPRPWPEFMFDDENA